MAHPTLTAASRAHVRQALRAKGCGLLESFRLARDVDDDMMEAALASAPEPVRAEVSAVGALGDGAILERILAFFNSELGKSLIAILVKLLTGI